PDVRDGLKPVHRRILWTMHEDGMVPGGAWYKSARLVGDVMGKYHPHGDAAIYDTIVGMAQDFKSRYPLVAGHGNFGSIYGDSAAAMRYTEVRMAPLAQEMVFDIGRDTVDMVPNYDNKQLEPAVLPSRIPNLLINGSMGIAVVYTTNIPPHNLREVCDAALLYIDNPNATVDELMKVLPGPDFPTAGLILGTQGIRQAYETGRGTITMQAKTAIEPLEGGRSAIVITEIPFMVNAQRLIEEQIAGLVKEKKLPEVSAIHDHSDRHGMRIVVELKRDSQPRKVLNYLLKHTSLRCNFNVMMLALVDRQPRVLSLREMLHYYVEHRKDVITRRSNHELRQLKDHAHILEGLRIALFNLDPLIQTIKESPDPATARVRLVERFGLSHPQAVAILQMQLQRLTGLEQRKIEDDYRQTVKRIAYLEDLLSDPEKILGVIRQDLKEIRDKYGDDRRTRIIAREASDIGEEDVIAEEDTIVTITRDGYIKRVPIDTFRSQHRGGRGVIAANAKEEDSLSQLFIATTHHYVLFFTDKGKVYRLKAYEVPQASRTAMGTAIINLIPIESGERITATVPVRSLEADGYLVMATERGVVKKTRIAEFNTARKGGLIAMNIEPGDELRWVDVTDGECEIMLITREGHAVRFHEQQVRPMGRAAAGVRGVSLRPGDQVVAMTVSRPEADLLVVTDKGYGKRTPVSEYRTSNRGTMGVITMKLGEKVGHIVDAKVVDDDDKLLMMTENGIAIRIRVSDIRRCGRSTQGVRLINVNENDHVARVERVVRKQHHASEAETDGTLADQAVGNGKVKASQPRAAHAEMDAEIDAETNGKADTEE
ncbi:MAG TPA: DNA gyrase subunit A, partial [Armatimonadota bacterium]|nr:DNA gyrase subunit A [Armatimonadota bacterium]